MAGSAEDVLKRDVPHHGLHSRDIGAGIEGDNQRIRAGTAGEGSDRDAAVSDVAPGHSHLARAVAFMMDGQAVVGRAAGAEAHRQHAARKIKTIRVADRHPAVEDYRRIVFGVANRAARQGNVRILVAAAKGDVERESRYLFGGRIEAEIGPFDQQVGVGRGRARPAHGRGAHIEIKKCHSRSR